MKLMNIGERTGQSEKTSAAISVKKNFNNIYYFVDKPLVCSEELILKLPVEACFSMMWDFDLV